jgi:hypothetical protein
MKSIIINSKNNTIEMTKKFENAAKRFGSNEYRQLQEARRDYPSYKVVVKAAAAKKESYKGLTFKYMESYIQKHDETGDIFAEYQMLRARTEDAEEAMAESATYGEIKKWFLDKYPAIAEFHEKREKLLAA